MGETSIEWVQGDDGTAGRSWNPTVGCSRISPGCGGPDGGGCYAEAIATRFAGTKAFPNGFAVTLRPERLRDPLRWRKPARVFVDSASDLFHDEVPDDYIAHVFAVMAATPQHTYMLLTKRHGRMRSLLNSQRFWLQFDIARTDLGETEGNDVASSRILPNLWVGVSAENQGWADIRIPHLLSTPAAVRFVSAELLIGPVRLDPLWGHGVWGPGLDWCIAGGESGPRSRPCDPQWIADLVTDCHELGITPFVKQLGSLWDREHGRRGKGGDPDTWPKELRVREFPKVAARV